MKKYLLLRLATDMVLDRIPDGYYDSLEDAQKAAQEEAEKASPIEGVWDWAHRPEYTPPSWELYKDELFWQGFLIVELGPLGVE